MVAADRRIGYGARGRWSGTVKARSGGGVTRRVELTGECQAFRGTLAAEVIVCRAADPEEYKGLIERSHDYLERYSSLPGRTFASPTDFNAQLSEWLTFVDTRTRRALGCATQ